MRLGVPHATALAALSLALAGCGGDGSSSSRSGSSVFTESACRSCHTLDGEGNREPGGDLSTVGARRSPAELRSSLTDPPSGMPAYSTLGEADLARLVDFLAVQR
jgi:mono/diheme cytochrome c family protein